MIYIIIIVKIQKDTTHIKDWLTKQIKDNEEYNHNGNPIESNILSYNLAFEEILSKFVSSKDQNNSEFLQSIWKTLFGDIITQINGLKIERFEQMKVLGQIYDD